MLKNLILGAEEIIGQENLEKNIKQGKQLRIKHGVDPTTSELHLGYVVNYRVIRRFQDQGHIAILLIGDFTGRIGDPTDKIEARQGQSKEALRKKAQNIIKLASRILDPTKLEIRYNSEWWDKISLDSFMRLAKRVSASRLWERDMFEKRVKQGKPVWAHELLYPILQAHDSVELAADLTVVGSDQKFNELLARDFQKDAGQDPQALIIMPILPGTDGKEKMSQSLGNTIGIDENPKEIYGKLMSMPDKNIVPYFVLLTDIKEDEIDFLKKALASGKKNPRDAKMELAKKIVTALYGQAEAERAEENFKKIFQRKEKPEQVAEHCLNGEDYLVDVLVKTKLAVSRSNARRLIEGGGVKINDRVVDDPMLRLKKADTPILIQKGKRFFVKII